MSSRYWVERNLYQKVKNPIKKNLHSCHFWDQTCQFFENQPVPCRDSPREFWGISWPRRQWKKTAMSVARMWWTCGKTWRGHQVTPRVGHGRWNWRNTWQLHHVMGCYGSSKDGHGNSGCDHLAQEEEIVFLGRRFDWFQVSWGKKPRDPRTTIRFYYQNLWETTSMFTGRVMFSQRHWTLEPHTSYGLTSRGMMATPLSP